MRFRRRIRALPGVRVNVSKSGIGVSAGRRGLRVGVGPRGSYTTVGLPGTGLSRRKAIQHLRRVCAHDATFEDAAERLQRLSTKQGR
jgi:hypothetical protein